MISYLSDMDGVLIKEGEMIPGADKFIQALKDNDIEYMVLTNNSMSTPRDLSARLRNTGLDIPAERIWTSATATANFLSSQVSSSKAYVVGESGLTTAMPNAGRVEFQQDGTTYRIEAIAEPGAPLFLIFADRTSGHESYAAARFLYAERPVDGGTTVVDFNLAYNPPCAFTEFSTCPLPPASNRLDLRIEAGEKKPRKPATT